MEDIKEDKKPLKNVSPSWKSKVFIITMAAGVYLTIGGIYLYVVHDFSIYFQYTLLLHILIGLIFLIPFGIYLYNHFIDTLGKKTPWGRIAGYISVVLIAVISLTGIYHTFVGFRKDSYWISTLHTWTGFVGAIVVTAHIVSLRFVRKRLEKREQKVSDIRPVYAYASKSGVMVYILFSVSLFIFQGLLSATYKDIEYKSDRNKSYSMKLGDNPFAPSEATIDTGDIVDARLIGNSKACATRDCHVDIYNQWYSSVHRWSSTDVFYRKTEQYMIDTAGKESTRYCGGCHDAVALFSGALNPGEGLDSLYSDEGSSCIVCHSINKLNHLKGSGSYNIHIPPKRYLFANREGWFYEKMNNLLIATSPGMHIQEYSKKLYSTPEYCAACHTQYVEGLNDWGWVKLQDQYGEWLASHYSGRNDKGFNKDEVKVCRDCHMPLVKSNDPSAGSDGMVRSHRFIAANTAIPWLDGDKEQFELTKKWLKSRKILIDIFVPRDKEASRNMAFIDNAVYKSSEPIRYVTMGEEVDIKVLLTNAGVGHGFPNGPLDVFEAWLEVKVVDAQNNIIFWSGQVDEEGHVKREKTRFLISLGVDRRGRLMDKHNIWHMIGSTYKKMINPGFTDLSSHKFVIPYWVKGDITIMARLRYRRFNKWYTDWVFEGKDVRLPIIDMARATVSIPVRTKPEKEKGPLVERLASYGKE